MVGYDEGATLKHLWIVTFYDNRQTFDGKKTIWLETFLKYIARGWIFFFWTKMEKNMDNSDTRRLKETTATITW